MRQSDRSHLVDLVPKLESGTLNRSDTVALFMLMRADSPNNSAIKDIGHTVAHDNRDRGVAHRHVNAFVDNFMEVALKGGRLDIRVLFPIEQVIAEISAFLLAEKISIDEAAVHAGSEHLIEVLADILDGTEIILRRDDARAELSGGPQPTFTLWVDWDRHPGAEIFAGKGLAVPMLIERRP